MSGLRARIPQRVYESLPILGIVLAAGSLAAAYSLKASNWAVMTDELQSSKLATSIAETFSPEPRIHGAYYNALSQLYPLLIAPFFRLFTAPVAIEAAHALNGLLLASAAWPAALLARRITRSQAAGCVAGALTAFVPWLVLSATLLTENAAYPVMVWSVLLMHRALAVPSRKADAAALLGLVLAFFARTQLIVLALGFPLALAWHELACELGRSGSGLTLAALRRGGRHAVTRHRLLVSGYALGGIAALALAGAGRLEEILGTYAGTVRGNPFPAGVWRAAAVHLDSVVIGVGLVPILLACSWAFTVMTRPRNREAQAFAALLFVLAPLITLQAASFDERFTPGGFAEDRYLAYLAPLFAVGAAAAVVDRDRRGLRAALVVGLAVAFSFLTQVKPRTPATVIFWASPAAAFHGALGSAASSIDLSTSSFIGLATLAIGVVVGATVWLASRPATPIAICATAVAFGIVEAAYVFDRFAVPTTTRPRTIAGVRRDWVDAALPDASSVALVPNPNLPREFWWDAEFWNKRVDRVLRIDGNRIYTPFPADQLSLDRETGVVRALGAARFLVVASSENRIHFRNSTVVFSAPPLKLIAVGRRARADWSTSGSYPDGWSRPGRPLLLRLFPHDGGRAREARLTLRAPPARVGLLRFVVRTRGFLRRGRLEPNGVRRLSIPVCVPSRRVGTVMVFSRNGVRISDGRVVGLRIQRMRVVDSGKPCRP
jgi:hypothetical protein